MLIATKSKNMDEQLKLAHKLIDIVDRANRKFCVTQQRNKLDKRKSSCVRLVRFIARKELDEIFQQIVFMNYKREVIVHILEAMNSVYDDIFTKKPVCNVIYLLSIIFFSFESG